MSIEAYRLIDDATEFEVGTVADVAALTEMSAQEVYDCVSDGRPIDGISYSLLKPRKAHPGEHENAVVPPNGYMPDGGDVNERKRPRPEAPILEPRPGLRPVYEFDLSDTADGMRSYVTDGRGRRTRSWPSVTAAAIDVGITDGTLKGLISAALVWRDKRYSFEPQLPAAQGTGTAVESTEEVLCEKNSGRRGTTGEFDSASGGITSPAPTPKTATGDGAGAAGKAAAAPRASASTRPSPSATPAPRSTDIELPPPQPQEQPMVTATPKHFSEIESVLKSKSIPPNKGASMAIGGGIAGSYKNDHSRLAKQIEATDERGQTHECRSLDAAASLTGISPPKIRKSLASGEAVHARGSVVLWKFRLGKGAKQELVAAAAPPPEAIMRQWDNSTAPVAITGRGESLPGALAAVASMGAGYSGLTLSNVSVTGRPDGSWELKFERLEIVRA